MAMDHNPQSQGHARRHFHRGRRGAERRGTERRGPAPDQGTRSDVDVEQIMRDIRARIAQRSGVELTTQQIQELAARRLESILDPRSVKPALLDQLRAAARALPEATPAAAETPYTFEDSTLYESNRGLMRWVRKLLNPVLKLFFNPNPLIRALNVQARLNVDAARREAERDLRQAEWNALHYELLQRLVTEVARLSLEEQSVALKVEALSAKIDFNERRVRGIEGALHQPRHAGRREPHEAVQASPPSAPAASPPLEPAPTGVATGPASEGTRRRRRRRRGRRGEGVPGDMPQGTADVALLDQDAEGSEREESAEEGDVVMASEGALTGDPDSPVVAEALVASEPPRTAAVSADEGATIGTDPLPPPSPAERPQGD